VKVDVLAIAPGLTLGEDGIWRASAHAAVDYPDEANAFCFAIEEASFWFNHRNRIIADTVRRFPPGGVIADIGAGNGYVALALERAGFAAIAIEPGMTGARNARSRGLTTICATLGEAGFRPGSLAAAGLFDVLEHLRDDGRFLREVHQRLRPRGRLYLSVPACPWLWSAEDDLVGHHRRYTARALRAVCESAGFRVEWTTYFFWPLPLPLFLLRTLPSRLGRRTTLDPHTTAGELRPSRLVDGMMASLLGAEERWLGRGGTLPIGTSCLLVATAQ
jgi:SAM-dependent methyltransferase